MDISKSTSRAKSLLLINPNTNGAVTEQVLRAALDLAEPDIRILATNPRTGPFSIESPRDRTAAIPEILALIEKDTDHDGFVLACFDDIAIEEARLLSGKPVVSLAEAGIRAAAERAGHFAVVTTFPGAIPAIERLINSYGFAGRGRVYATGSGVAEAAERRPEAEAKLADAIANIRQDGVAEVIILGSGAYVGRGGELSTMAGIPVIDGLGAAMAFCLGTT